MAASTKDSQPQETRYYASETYLLPSDEEERSRLEIQYRMILSYTKDLLPANLTLEDGDAILDAGTGTGIWLNDVAKEVSPTISLVGIDIEGRLFPPPLPNQTFKVQSSLELPADWSSRFAFCHQSLMGLAFSSDAWKTCAEQYFRVLKPGGIIQLQEYDVLWTMGHDIVMPPYSVRALNALRQLCGLKNIDPDMYPKIAGLLTAAGFVDVQISKMDIPLAKGGKATDALRSSIDAWRGMKGAVIKLGGLGMAETDEQFDVFLEAMAEEWRQGDFSMPYIIWTARKGL